MSAEAAVHDDECEANSEACGCKSRLMLAMVAFMMGAAAGRAEALAHFGAGKAMRRIRDAALPEPGELWGNPLRAYRDIRDQWHAAEEKAADITEAQGGEAGRV